MTEKEIEKEQLQEGLKPDEVHSENPSEPTPDPEPQINEDNGNGEVTLRDVVDVLKKGFSEISGKLDTVSGKLDTVAGKLSSIDGTLKNLRGDITEMSLYSLLTDYMIEKKMHKEFTLMDAPRKVEKGEADFVVIADGKTIYIVEVKTSVSKSNVGQLGTKFSSKYKSLKETIKNIDDYEIRGVIAARYVIANINPNEIRKKFPYPIYIFTFVPSRRGYALLTLEEFIHEKEGDHQR